MGERAPGVLKANFEVKVFEPGGDFSIDHFSMPYHVFDSYVGVAAPEGDRLTGMLVTDKAHQVSIVNVNAPRASCWWQPQRGSAAVQDPLALVVG